MTHATRRTGVLTAVAIALSVSVTACGSDDSTTAGSGGGDTGAAGSSAAAGSGSDIADRTFGPGCSSIPSSGSGSFDGMVKDPVATAASNNPLLSTLVTAVTKAGLVDTLNGADGLTVFAPTNDAFAKIPAAQLKKVLANKKMLTEILTHHVISGQLAPSSIDGSHTTLDKDHVKVSGGTDGMTVDGAKVLCGNIPTANATVYVIDTVLMPQDM
ncbi:MAG: fasciclin domain-containing protein [Nocardioides sp.]|uniref:fasciclin domain-containing protein n=1 Tax=Nocardioides sp. TaxID=35761 RepID=UPI0039E51C49